MQKLQLSALVTNQICCDESNLRYIELDQVDRAGGDGAYDTYEVWDLLKERKILGIIPP